MVRLSVFPFLMLKLLFIAFVLRDFMVELYYLAV